MKQQILESMYETNSMYSYENTINFLSVIPAKSGFNISPLGIGLFIKNSSLDLSLFFGNRTDTIQL